MRIDAFMRPVYEDIPRDDPNNEIIKYKPVVLQQKV